MANHKSAEKRHRQNVKRNARNRSQRSELTTLVKKVALLSEEAAILALRQAQSKLAKAARKGLIHKRSAAKKVSSLMTKLAKKAA